MRVTPWIVAAVAGTLGLAGCAGGDSAGRASAGASASTTSPPTSPAPTVPLQWESVLTLEEAQVTSLAATPAGTFVVTGGIRAEQCDPTPMWSDGAGATLEPLDVDALLGEGASVMQVIAGGPGVVAVGCLPDPYRLVVWTSADGATWTSSETGYQLPKGERRFWIGSVAAGQDHAIVAGGEYTDILPYVDVIEQAARKRMPASLLPYAESNSMVEPQRASVTIGPFSAWSATLADLGVDPEVGSGYEAAVTGGAGSPVTITTDDFRTWTVAREPPIREFPMSSIAGTDAGFLATSWSDMAGAPVVFASADGMTWSAVDPPVGTGTAYPPTADGQRVVMGTESRETGVGLWQTSDLGTTWAELTPSPAGYWGTPAVGPMGLLSASSVENPQEDPIEFSLTRGTVELTVLLRMDGGSVRVTDDGRTLVDDIVSGGWRMATTPPSVTFDNDAGEMAIVDPATGRTLMSVPYAEVETAFGEAVKAAGVGSASAAFSADGLSWSAGPLPPPPDRFSGAGPVAVGEDAAWVAVSHAFGVSELMRGTLP